MFNWVAAIAIKKSASKGIKAFTAMLAGGGALEVLKQLGITVQIDENLLAAGIGSALLGLYEIFRNYEKSKGEKGVPLP